MVSSVAVLRDAKRPVVDVEFSAGSDRLAAGSRDGNVYVYRTGDWVLERTLAVGRPVNGVLWSPEGDVLALDEGGGITAWEARTGRSLGSVRGDGFGGRLLDFEWVPGTELLAVAESDSTTGDAGVNVVDASSPDPVDWSLVTRKLFVGLPGSKLEFIHDLDFNVDGTRLAAVQRFKGDVVVVETGSRDPGDWRVSTTLEFSKPFEAEFSGGSVFLAVSDEVGAAEVLVTDTWGTVATLDVGTPGPLAWSPLGDQLAVTQRRPPFSTGFWASVNWRQTGATSDGHGAPVNASAWARNGRWVATGGQDGAVVVWGVPVPRRAEAPASAIFEQRGPFVTEVRVPGRDPGELFVGEAVELVFVVGNPLNRRAEGVLVATADGRTVGTSGVDLGPGETVERSLVWTPERIETDEVCGVVNGVRTCREVGVTVSPSDVERFLEEFGLELALPEEIEDFFLSPLRKMVEGV